MRRLIRRLRARLVCRMRGHDARRLRLDRHGEIVRILPGKQCVHCGRVM